MRVNLHWKLTLLFCLAALSGIFAGYLVLMAQFKPALEKNIETTLQKELFLAKESLELRLDPQGNLPAAQALVAGLGRRLEARVTVVTADGTVFADSQVEQAKLAQLDNHADRPEIRQAAAQAVGTSRRYSYSVKKDMLYQAIRLEKSGRVAGYLRLAVPVTAIAEVEARVGRLVGLSLLAVFGVSVFFALIIVATISRPLGRMAAQARAMAEGDFTGKTILHRQDEMGDLSKALAYLSERIQEQMDRLKKEGAKFDAVVNSMFEGIAVVDAKGRILLMNPSLRNLFAVERDPEGAKPIEVIRSVAVQDLVDSLLKKEGIFLSEQIELNNPDQRFLKVNAAPIIRDRLLEGGVLVFHDITELRRLEKVRQDFVANVSHELRTPIASIHGYAETLLGGAMRQEEHLKDFLEIIYQDSGRLAKLINDLLDLSRIESGQMKLTLEPLEVQTVLNRALKVLKKPVEAKKLRVSCQIEPACPKVKADADSLAQVFLNLLDNAIKYTPEGGSICVTARQSDGGVQIDVTDTGVGISAEDLPRIFERFYRVDKGRSRELGGTGLGLSIVKHIVYAHGGEVQVESVIGQGSTFRFTLPPA
ncbi:MAG: ATP-binding protein [Candidatus Omnitrophota bacterium]